MLKITAEAYLPAGMLVQVEEEWQASVVPAFPLQDR
jgi:hypothetical protein